MIESRLRKAERDVARYLHSHHSFRNAFAVELDRRQARQSTAVTTTATGAIPEQRYQAWWPRVRAKFITAREVVTQWRRGASACAGSWRPSATAICVTSAGPGRRSKPNIGSLSRHWDRLIPSRHHSPRQSLCLGPRERGFGGCRKRSHERKAQRTGTGGNPKFNGCVTCHTLANGAFA
jgi:hypothetical protein